VPIQIAAARNPLFPDAPAIMEFAKDERTRKILQLILAPLEMDRPILAPPGVPEERVAALCEAFHAAMNDPAFIAEAEKDHLEIREVSGRRIEEILSDAFAMPPEIAKAATEAAGTAPTGSE
jgi:hypothetical protein